MLSHINRNMRKFAPLFFRRTYFTETFSDKDKFASELKDYPTIVEGLEGEFAKELFRYAYNIDQIGYFKYSLEYINSLAAQHRFVEKEFQEELKNAGVPSVIGIEFLTNVHESMLGDSFGEIVSSYNDLYNAYFKVTPGTLSLGQVSIIDEPVLLLYLCVYVYMYYILTVFF
jgi:hypothetical protein